MKLSGPVSLCLAVTLLIAWNVRSQTPIAEKSTLDADPHLVGWWKFDEISGQQVRDSSPQKRPGVLQGGATLESCSAPGRIGAALKFDGKNALLRIPGFKGVTGPHARSVAVWIKTSSQTGELVSWGSEEAGKKFTFGFIRARIGVVPKGGYLFMNAPVHDQKWHHVAVVVQEASPPNLHDHVKLYKDGDRAEIGDIGLLDLWPLETGDASEVQIGRRFDGLLDDLRIYDRALSEDEITALFKNAK